MNNITAKILIKHIEEFYEGRDIMRESDYNHLKELSLRESDELIIKQSDELRGKDDNL